MKVLPCCENCHFSKPAEGLQFHQLCAFSPNPDNPIVRNDHHCPFWMPKKDSLSLSLSLSRTEYSQYNNSTSTKEEVQ